MKGAAGARSSLEELEENLRAITDEQSAPAVDLTLDIHEADRPELEERARGLTSISRALLQLVRNTLLYAMDSPELRLATGKPERARLSISIRLQGPGIKIVCEVDGRKLHAREVRTWPEMDVVRSELRNLGARLSIGGEKDRFTRFSIQTPARSEAG